VGNWYSHIGHLYKANERESSEAVNASFPPTFDEALLSKRLRRESNFNIVGLREAFNSSINGS
jgi:hypothetical protein